MSDNQEVTKISPRRPEIPSADPGTLAIRQKSRGNILPLVLALTFGGVGYVAGSLHPSKTIQTFVESQKKTPNTPQPSAPSVNTIPSTEPTTTATMPSAEPSTPTPNANPADAGADVEIDSGLTDAGMDGDTEAGVDLEVNTEDAGTGIEITETEENKPGTPKDPNADEIIEGKVTLKVKIAAKSNGADCNLLIGTQISDIHKPHDDPNALMSAIYTPRKSKAKQCPPGRVFFTGWEWSRNQ